MGLEKDPLADEMAEKETGLTREILKSLSEPFPEEAIGWKAQALYPKDNPTQALAVPYITSRHVMDRLDEVVGPAGWQTDFEFVPGIKAAKVMLTVFGITKSDIGFVAGDDDAAIKGSVSDGLKRAAVLFGIGRYLYEAKRQWVGWDSKKRQFSEQPKLIFKNGPKPTKAKKARKASPISEAPMPTLEEEEGAAPTEGMEVITKKGNIYERLMEDANHNLEKRGYEGRYQDVDEIRQVMEAGGVKGRLLVNEYLDYLTIILEAKETSE